jgi:hydroxyacylglutathione hydrolase
VILRRIVSSVFGENCYVVAGAPGGSAVVVDPGAGVADAVRDMLARDGLTLGCVLLTHGHPDHVWDAAEVAGDRPVYVSGPDLPRLTDPWARRHAQTDVMRALFPGEWQRPAVVTELPPEYFTAGGAQIIPGLVTRALAAPGHTEGCTVYFLAGELDGETAAMAESGAGTQQVALTGDVIFRDSIGRTDLPGGDHEVMIWTLRTLKSAVDPATLLFPGHGPATTMAREIAHNPFLSRL